jgi:hypothetical protein
MLFCLLQLAALLGVKRRSIVIAPEATVSQLTGFTSGQHTRMAARHALVNAKCVHDCHKLQSPP